MKTYDFRLHTVVMLLTLLSTGCGGESESLNHQTEMPNMVIIHVDDLGWADLSGQGSTFYETPHIDGLGASGVRFTQGYAAATICSPTRAALMAAQNPARLGITDWIRAHFQQDGDPTPDEEGYVDTGEPLHTPATPYELSTDVTTIAERLQRIGYRTLHIGKWHLGGEGYHPQNQGFDLNIGGSDLGEPPSFFDPYSNQRVDGIEYLPPRREGEYLTDREADEAVRLIREHRDQPFFLHLAPYAVHTPIQAPEETIAYYESRFASPTHQNAAYAAMIHHLDQMVGRIVQTLEEEGLKERTLLVFTSDNGGQSDERGITSNHPLRSGKGYPWEGGLRVPMMISWPGVITPGGISHTPVHTVDVAATFLELAGVLDRVEEPVDGVSLLTYLREGHDDRLEERPMIWHFPHYRQGRRVTPNTAMRVGPWKLVKWYEGPEYELYHLIDDPAERTNLSSRHPEVVRELSRILEQELEEMGAKLPRQSSEVRQVEPSTQRGIISETLLQEIRSWDGERLPNYPEGQPEVRLLRITIAPGERLPMHKHPYINVGFLLEGELIVESENGDQHYLSEGEPIVELVNSWHYGRNPGSEPAVILVYYSGVEGDPVTVPR